MSKKIDERVVEMRFDNKQFESATATSMSTLDKLKQKLNFTGASKGLDNIGTSAKNAERSMTPLASAVQTVETRFSALQVIGATALANITNSAVNAGKRLISALTVEPVMSGLQEYELQMNSIQTILANTQSKGSTLDDVNTALAHLNEYADQTIYNFAEMTRNIGTFTAAGVDLDTSVSSIKGIANLAAISGSNAQQASTAMYQLSQAIAAGKVQLMDWNSVVYAGMGGEVFQTALKRTAEHFGMNVDAMIAKYGTFRESLTKGGWLTTEVLTETLTQLSGAYTEADLLAQGYSAEQAKEIVQLAETAVSAATDVRTFTGMIDTLKESLTSGWAQTWQSIIGDFEGSKKVWTEISELIGGAIQATSDARNEMVSGAFESNWQKILNVVSEAGIEVEEFNTEIEKTVKSHGWNVEQLVETYGSLGEAFRKGALSSELIVETFDRMGGGASANSAATEDLTKKLEKFQKVVDEVWKGNYKNSDTGRIELLTKAGYDYAEVQALVNKTVDGHRLTLEDLNEEQLKSIGYTDEEVKVLKDLAAQARDTGTTLGEAIANITQKSGTELFWEGVLNVLQSILDIGGAIREAWNDAFGMDSDSLYRIIEGFHNLTEALKPSARTIENLTSIFKGLFAILDIIVTLVGGAVKAVFSGLGVVLGEVNFNILDLPASIGEAIASFRDWLLSAENLEAIFGSISKGVAFIVNAIRDFIDAFLDFPIVQNIINNFKASISELTQIGHWITEGLQNGLQNGITAIPEMLANIGRSLLNAIKTVLGIHSPSTEMEEIGENAMLGLKNGITNNIGSLFETVEGIGTKILDILKNIPWGTVAAAGISVALVIIVKQLIGVIGAVTAPLRGFGDMMTGLGEVFQGVGTVLDKSAKQISKILKSVSKVISAFAFKLRMDAIGNLVKSIGTSFLNLAIGIGVLAASVWVLSKIDAEALTRSIISVAALAGVMAALTIVVGKFGSAGGLKLLALGATISGFAFAMIMLAAALKILDTLNPDKAAQTLTAFGTIVVGIGVLIATFGKVVTPEASRNIAKLGAMMFALSAAMLIMVLVIRLMSLMSLADIGVGMLAMGGFVGIIALCSAITKLASKEVTKFGRTMIALAVAMGLMLVVLRLVSLMSLDDIAVGIAALAGFAGIIALLALITNINRVDNKLGRTILSISAAMLLLVAVTAILGSMDVGAIAKGEAAILGFVGIIALLTKITNYAGKNAAKLSATILAFSIAIGLLAGVAILLSLINIGGLMKGVLAIGILGVVMAGLIAVTQYAKNVYKNIVALTVAIGVMAAAIALLSLIEPTALIAPTAAMAALMGMFALILKTSRYSTKAMKSILAIGAVVAGLAVILGILSGMPIDGLIASAASLSGLLLALSAAIQIVSKAGKISTSALVSVGIMTGVMAAVAGILYLLSGMPIETCLGVTASLSILLLALTAATLILSKAQAISLTAIGAVAVLGAIVIGVGLVLALISALDISTSLETVIGLSTLLIALSTATLILSKIGAGAMVAISGAVALAAVLGILAGVLVIAGGLSKIPGLQELVADGGEFLATVGYAIGNFVGSIVGGFSAGMTSGLPDMATNLSTFMTNLQPFIDGASGLDASMLEGVKSLASTILILTGADLLSAITSWITGEDALTKFTAALVPLGTAIKSFSNTVGGDKIDGPAITASANALKTLAEATAEIPNEGGILAKIVGENDDLEGFKEDLRLLGEGIKAFAVATAGIKPDTVNAAAQVGLTLTKLAGTVPNSGGLVSFITGDNNDFEAFGDGLEDLGEGIKGFADATAGMDPDVVTAAANAGLALTRLAGTVPNTGGLVSFFTGDNDLALFGAKLVSFGWSMRAFGIAVAGIDTESVNAAVNIGSALTALNDTVPNTGGLVTFFTGDNDLAAFGEKLVSFGTSLKDFGDEVADFDSQTAAAAVNSARSLMFFSKAMDDNDIDFDNLEEFGKDLSKFGEKFSDYYGDVESVDTLKLSAVTTQLNRLITMATTAEGVDFASLGAFGDSLGKLGDAGIDEFISAFTDATVEIEAAGSGMVQSLIDGADSRQTMLVTKIQVMLKAATTEITTKLGTFKMAGSDLINKFIEGVDVRVTAAIAGFSKMMDDSVKAVRNKRSMFVTAGGYVVDGLAEGIRNNAYKVRNEGTKLGKVLEDATNKQLVIRSPSKIFSKIGNYVVSGLTSGIGDKLIDVDSIGATLGDTLLNSTMGSLDISGGVSYAMTEDVGIPIVEGIATGIEQDTSAEEAAQQKAQSIADAFQTGLDNASSDMDIADLEYELWGKVNPNASENEKSVAEAENLLRKIESQRQRVALAYSEYVKTRDTFGESSEYTKDAYQKMLQEQINLASFGEEYNTLLDTIASNQTAATEANAQAYMDYIAWLDESQDFLLKQGFKLEDIQKAAQENTGYDPNYKPFDIGLEKVDIAELVSGAMQEVSGAVTTAVAESTPELVSESTDAGTTVGTSVATGISSGVSTAIQNESPTITQNVSSMVSNAATQIEAGASEWTVAAGKLVDGFISGIKSRIGEVGETAKGMAQAACDSAVAVINTLIPAMTKKMQNATILSLDSFDPITETVSKIAALFDSDEEIELVITPVFNMDEARTQAEQLYSMFGASRTMGLSASIIRAQNEMESEADTSSGGNTTYQFTQNNYSPKALSAIEIYRQTKNQFSAFERKAKT